MRDERRTESYKRPAIDEEYEIVASKVQKFKEEPEKRQNAQQMPKSDLRINYLSPSPDQKLNTTTIPQAANVRKGSAPVTSNHLSV